jgi:hypothetical protein
MVALAENGERRTGLQLSKRARAFTVSQESEDPVVDAGGQGRELGLNLLERLC